MYNMRLNNNNNNNNRGFGNEYYYFIFYETDFENSRGTSRLV